MERRSRNPRRARGALEARVLHVLWHASGALTPGEIRAALDADGIRLAHTTVITVLSRLQGKGMVERERAGRTYAYVASQSEEATTAARMRALLDATEDHRAALANFVSELSTTDESALRELLGREDS